MDIILKAENISKKYGRGEGMVQALKSCSLSFKKGEMAAIAGKSGSGKSTLLKILGTLETTDTGDVILENKSITNLNDSGLSKIRRTKIGFVYQDYNLLPEFTAYENIIMPIKLDGRKPDENRINELMELLGIAAYRNKFPNEMSGGEQQRVSIARAIAIEPAIILADEPTGNLDSENSTEVVMLMSKAAKLYGQTIVMVTHDMQTAEYADRIIYLKDGEIVTCE